MSRKNAKATLKLIPRWGSGPTFLGSLTPRPQASWVPEVLTSVCKGLCWQLCHSEQLVTQICHLGASLLPSDHHGVFKGMDGHLVFKVRVHSSLSPFSH